LNEAAREVLALLAGDLHRSNVVLSTGFAVGLPRVGGDRIQLQQVIMNLVRNAADAMEEIEDRPRLLTISTQSDHDHVKLTVRDAGPGFGSEDPDTPFQAFYTTKSEGMGIGLSVSRSIIESHGGRLWAEVDGGPGASLSFTLPCYAGGCPSNGAADSRRAPAASEPS
jgi:C4-dicarboxylate-specific signal transduction histidine kinase